MWDKILLISTNTYLKVENMPTIGFEIGWRDKKDKNSPKNEPFYKPLKRGR